MESNPLQMSRCVYCLLAATFEVIIGVKTSLISVQFYFCSFLLYEEYKQIQVDMEFWQYEQKHGLGKDKNIRLR